MVWENNFFYILLMNAIVGNVAYLLARVLAKVAEHYGCDRLAYNMLKGVEVFFIVPFSYLYVKLIKGGRITGHITGYDGNTIVANVFHVIFVIWLVGAVSVSVYYVRRYRMTRRLCANNLPYDDPQVREMFCQLYPDAGLEKVEVFQNFMVPSPCIVGVLRPKLLMPEKTYSPEELRVILAHEATHVVHRDNLWKCIGLAIVIATWWNPLIYAYLKEWDTWAETHCDATVCRKFLDGDGRRYAAILMVASMGSQGVMPPGLTPFAGDRSITGRVMRLKKIKHSKKKAAFAVLLSAVFIAGSTLTAVAAGHVTSEVGVTAYYNTLDKTSGTALETFDSDTDIINLDNIDNVNVCVMSAEEVAELGDAIVVMDVESGISTYATQKYFNWDVASGRMGVSANMLKLKDKLIEASAYITSSTGSVEFGIIRPDGSFVYATAPANRTTTFAYTTERYGYYKVAVYNITSGSINANGFYVH